MSNAKLVGLLFAVNILQYLAFPNRAWSDGETAVSPTTGGKIMSPRSDALPSAGQFDQAYARLRSRYTLNLIDSAKELPPNLRDAFITPNQMQTFITEVKMQFDYLDSDMKKSGHAQEWKGDAANTAPEIIQGFVESRFAPYDLRQSVWLFGLLELDQKAAESIGDKYLANRFSALQDKFRDHLTSLCFMDDMALTMFAGSSLIAKDKEDLANRNK